MTSLQPQLPAGEYPIEVLQRLLGLQHAFSVPPACDGQSDRIEESYVSLRTHVEEEFTLSESCRTVHYNNLHLATAHLNDRRQHIERAMQTLTRRQQSWWRWLQATLSCGRSRAIRTMSARQLELAQRLAAFQNEPRAYPERVQCGIILPVGATIYALRDNQALFNGCSSLHVTEVTCAQICFENEARTRINIQYTLSDGTHFKVGPEQGMTELRIPVDVSHTRYYATRQAAADAFLTLRETLHLHIADAAG